MTQGEEWWADLPDPAGSGPGFRRPVVIVQGDALNRSRIATVVCVPLTSNLRWADAPGNVLLPTRNTGLPKDSVANVSQIIAIDRALLTERVGHITRRQIEQVLAGIELILRR
ncbi:MAG: type II toxin-antitoxin system PemK/MazF family toxin [Deltaproteobacteria bacterium]|nr:type II toxin-antitoxin system PemK/MazF family toxin [Deltaproteobacteria bacterium]